MINVTGDKFIGNPWKIPSEFFNKVISIINELGVEISVGMIAENSGLDLESCQEKEIQMAIRAKCKPIKITQSSYVHYKLKIQAGMKLEIFCISNPVESRRTYGCSDCNDGIVLKSHPNPTLLFLDTLQKSEIGIYFIVTLIALYIPLIDECLNKNIYTWSEKRGYTKWIDLNVTQKRFEFECQECDRLISIFGEKNLRSLFDVPNQMFSL